jgi:glutathione synthase/RimK-type ligase-like ATP-grasp enzyme
MPDISILYDQSETDELGIRLTAREMGIELGYIPFYKSAFTFDNNDYNLRTVGRDYTSELKNTRVVINRCQGKNRRIYGTTILEAKEKHVLNPLRVEENCQSKLKTLLNFNNRGIKIPRTTYASPNPKEPIGTGKYQDNIETILDLLEKGIGSDKVVIKPDAGSHGKGVVLSRNKDELREILRKVEQGITNTSGVVGQELIEKWFYDLRIIVKKEKGEHPMCYSNALARGGFKGFRTNTFLGNKVVRAKLPMSVMKTAEQCAEALADNSISYVIALDAMPSIEKNMMKDEEEIRQSFNELEATFEQVSRVKKMQDKKRKFEKYTEAINEAYESYMDTDAYKHIEKVVNSTLLKTADNVVFHEGNACPDFWEQTRIIAGLNLAEDFLECAGSLLDP